MSEKKNVREEEHKRIFKRIFYKRTMADVSERRKKNILYKNAGKVRKASGFSELWDNRFFFLSPSDKPVSKTYRCKFHESFQAVTLLSNFPLDSFQVALRFSKTGVGLSVPMFLNIKNGYLEYSESKIQQNIDHDKPRPYRQFLEFGMVEMGFHARLPV